MPHRDEIDHERIAQADYTSPDDFGCIVDCIDLQSLAVSKLDCLSNPTREKPRDIFDLVILIDMDIKPDPELIKTLDRDQIHRLKTELWDKLEKMDYATAEASLLPFLPKDKRFSEDKWHEMRLKVGCKVEEWLATIDVNAEHFGETELTDTGMTR